jgi:aryl-alcohol dehydrogenase-like predicted oxidoreductase
MLPTLPRRRLCRGGFDVPPLSLGGAMLGGMSEQEASEVLRIAADGGMGLVDTSSAYGHSEERIGRAPRAMAVATKFGNPCEVHDRRSNSKASRR